MTAERLEHYRYDAESGRLRQRIPDRAYDYDAGGRTTEDGRLRYRYGAQGRLVEITRASTGQRQAAYRYNALGERVRKLSTSVTYYHYDLEGRLLAETDASGQTRAEYLYLGHEPLALSRSGQLYYYHNDHLGMPQKLTDGAGQVVWSASYRPFGEASIGAGYVTQNLRFPGQYYDEESGLHYNYHRYYDPSIGRYITSDPIGLQGGINTYSYALQNPIIYIDPTGEAVPLVVAGGCVAGSLGAIFTGQSFSNIALTCSLGAIGTVGAAATASATAARIIAGLAGAAAGGLGAVSDAQGAPAPVVHVPNVIAPLPNFGSPDPLDDAITEAFCQQNPDAPNCKEDEPDDCE